MDGSRTWWRAGRTARSASALASALAIAWVAASAHAQGMLDFALELAAPKDAGCVEAVALQRAVETRIDRLVFLDDTAPSRRIRVSLQLDASAQVWTAAIAMLDQQSRVVGERALRGESAQCADLDEALIVVLSTLIGVAEPAPERSPARDEPQPEPASDRDDAASDRAKTPASPPAREPEAPQPPLRWDLSLNAAGQSDFGLTPELSFGAALGLELGLDHVRLLVSGSMLSSSRADLGGGARAHFRGAAGELLGCFEAARPLAGSLAFCLGGQAGAVEVRTTGLAVSARTVEPYVRALIGPRLRLPFLPGFGLSTQLVGTAPLFVPRFYVVGTRGERQYYHSVELGISGQLGVYWKFAS